MAADSTIRLSGLRRPGNRPCRCQGISCGHGDQGRREAASGEAAVKKALENDLDAVVLDVRMPDGDGLTALGRIKLDKPNLAVVMFSAFDNPANVARAIALGAWRIPAKGL